MGGLGPGIGGGEWLIIGIVALLVVGPERLPGLLRQLGKMVAKARGMANEFRSSFDEMARQSELDELRKEVEALRTGQNPVHQTTAYLGADADAAFKDIKDEFAKPVFSDPVMTPGPSEWPDTPAVMTPIATPAPVQTVPVQPVTEAAPVVAKAAVKKPVAKTAPAKPRARAAKTSPGEVPTPAKKPIRAKKLDL